LIGGRGNDTIDGGDDLVELHRRGADDDVIEGGI